MYNEFSKINDLIKDYFGENLVSLAVFGSTCRKIEFEATSDIDYIIIVNDLQGTQDKISRSLKNKLRSVFPLVAFNIYDKNNFADILKQNSWLTLTIKLGYEIHIDKDNFFKNIIENSFNKLKQQRIGKLAWYIEKQSFHKLFLDHYLQLSKQYFESAKILYKNNLTNIGLESLLNSIHCYMIRKLLAKNIFITTGEISQLFFKVYSNDKIYKLRDSFLCLEQIVNQKHSFEFDKKGEMIFLKKQTSKNKLIFIKTIRSFEKLNMFFNESINKTQD